MMPAAGADDEAAAKKGSPRDLILLGVAASLAGLGAGLIGALFGLALEQSDRFRDALISRMDAWGAGGFVLFVALAAGAAALAAWLVRRLAPAASGSGIPRVIAVLEGEVAPAPLRVIPVKFLAGTLAIGSGLALGREGPTVQMGATFAHQIGRVFGQRWTDGRAVMAAGAGAGLAVAFNAPIAGALFVFEALVKRFEARTALATLAACAVATWVGRAIAGNAGGFEVAPLSEPGPRTLPLFVVLGVAAGLAGVLYTTGRCSPRSARPTDYSACPSRGVPASSARPRGRLLGSRPHWWVEATGLLSKR
jgi:CIC family chloride channel protein